jgi:hypothetical protein
LPRSSSGSRATSRAGGHTSTKRIPPASSRTWTSGSAIDYAPCNRSSKSVARRLTANWSPGAPRPNWPHRSRRTPVAGGTTRPSASTPTFPTATSTGWASSGCAPHLNSPNRRMRTRTSGGVGGDGGATLRHPYPDSWTNSEIKSGVRRVRQSTTHIEKTGAALAHPNPRSSTLERHRTRGWPARGGTSGLARMFHQGAFGALIRG